MTQKLVLGALITMITMNKQMSVELAMQKEIDLSHDPLSNLNFFVVLTIPYVIFEMIVIYRNDMSKWLVVPELLMGTYILGCYHFTYRTIIYEPIKEVLIWLRKLNELDPMHAALAPTTYEWMYFSQPLNLSRVRDLQCWFAIREHLLLVVFPFLYEKINRIVGALLMGSAVILWNMTWRVWQETLVINDAVMAYGGVVLFGFLLFIISELSSIHSIQVDTL